MLALDACFLEFTSFNTIGVVFFFKNVYMLKKISQENSKAEKSVYRPELLQVSAEDFKSTV